MKVPISPRLRACCNFISPGERVADVGTDHGYLGIWLLQQEIARSVIASDIVPGPLAAAKKNAAKYGFSHKMEFYLSDGVRSIPRDFDTLVCAGMGADTMISILDAAPWLKDARYRMVLQCQSKTPMLRQYLSENGWAIQDEIALKDGKFLYTVMSVSWQPGFPLTTGEWYFPPAIQEKHPTVESAAYYHWVVKGLKIKISCQGENADPEHIEALNELESLPNNPCLSWLKEETQ